MSPEDDSRQVSAEEKSVVQKREMKAEISAQTTAETLDQAIQQSPVLRKTLGRMISMSVSSQQEDSAESKFLDAVGEKLTPDHITDIIKGDQQSEIRASQDSKYKLTLIFVGILVGVGLFIWLTAFLVKDNKDVYFEILKIVAIALGSFGAGYGFRSIRSKK